jgi:hypothetical protein
MPPVIIEAIAKEFSLGKAIKGTRRGAQLFRRGEEGLEFGVADGDAGDVAADFDAAQSLAHNVFQFARSQIGVLQRHHAQPGEALGRARHHLGYGVVDVPAHCQPVRRVEPIGQQLGHGRQHLAGYAGLVHRLDAPLHIPAFVADGAEILAGDHHVLVSAIRAGGHLRPARCLGLSGISGELSRDDMTMNVDGGRLHAKIPF